MLKDALEDVKKAIVAQINLNVLIKNLREETLTCPITCDTLKKTVMVPALKGSTTFHTFEDESIRKWFLGRVEKNPITNLLVSSQEILEDKFIATLLNILQI